MKQLKIAGAFILIAILLLCNPSTLAKAASTETYVAGIDLPNRFVVLPSIVETSSGKIKSLKMVTNEDYIQEYSSKEIAMLERIVEAEAGGEDIIGKILVANVVLNRVANEHFPDTIKEVIFDDGQFEPVSTGRYYDVTVSEETEDAVKYVTELGVDYSKGALFFHGRGFDGWSYLTKLYKYGNQTFYTY